MGDPYFRQVGAFAPARQLLSAANLRQKSADNAKKATIDEEKDSLGEMPELSSCSFSPLRTRGEPRPATVDPVIAVGLGDHGGVFVSGTTCVTTSDNFADLFAGMPNSKPGALYLRNARPRHGRAKPSQSRPVTVCSLPDLSKLQRSNMSRESDGGMVARSYSPRRGRTDSSSSFGSGSRASCAHSSELDPALDKWTRTGTEISKTPWVAKWAKKGRNHAVRQGEAMLREQVALDDAKDLYKLIESEGEESPMRRHITSRIRNRLREEKEKDEQGVIDAQQRCMNIRNNLGKMQAARRDLSEQKRKAEEALLGKEHFHFQASDNKAVISQMFRQATGAPIPNRWSMMERDAPIPNLGGESIAARRASLPEVRRASGIAS